MANVTDEMLMAYADGTLSVLAAAKVEAFLQSHPDARQRIEMFRATGAPLSKLYEQPIMEPVPDRLRDFVLNYPLNNGRSKTLLLREQSQSIVSKARGFVKTLGVWLNRPPPLTRGQLAAATAVGLAVAVGAGRFLNSPQATPPDLVAFENGHIYANGPLHDVLDKEVSGHETRISGIRNEAVIMRATLTFKSKEMSYCREYEIVTPDHGHFNGLGCRDRDGKWELTAHLPSSPPPKEGLKTAHGPESAALDQIVESLIEGDALGGAEERALIRSHWNS